MSLLINALNVYMPELVKKRALTQLFNVTAAAFELDAPPLAGLSSGECLTEYARFVQIHAEQRLHDRSDSIKLEQRLYQNAVDMGRLPARWLRPCTVEDVMTIGRMLYRILNIDFQGDARGEVVIRHCYFSDFYSAEVCRLMSAMDRGLFAGLSNGGELTFTARITEGQPCCQAHFCWMQKQANHPAGKTWQPSHHR